jgi:plastocyanin
MKSLWQVVFIPIVGTSFLVSGAMLFGCDDESVHVVPTTTPMPSPVPVSVDMAVAVAHDMAGAVVHDMAGAVAHDMATAVVADMAAAAAQTATVTVGPNNTLTFSPQTVTIGVGGSVHWVWSSTSIPHTVTSGANGVADGKFCSIPAGQQVSVARCSTIDYAHTAPFTFDQRFDTAGSFPYHCGVHGAIMSGTVIVQ